MSIQGVVFLVGIVVVIIAVYFSRDAMARRRLKGLPITPIASLPRETPARIVGRVVSDQTLQAPLTGRACVFYQVIVEQHRSGRYGGTWREIIRETEGVAFVVEDDTGRVSVDPAGADITLARDAQTRSGRFDDPSPTEQEFLDRHGKKGSGLIFNKTLRYREAIFEPAETIAVAGIARPSKGRRSADDDGESSDAPSLEMVGNADFGLTMSDVPDTTR